ncbi:hypothetical protein B0A55_01857 [Friedmanniomyces simplex]|uniref:RING-type domain-containing protein n=1 Tax=Friedmanniomyces simplex TaxID=329884 RepID=A0A4U0XSF6_9PEZI|nr:hypothetical protein B0A55_01857 [Friedmanniomyces simplex]
MSVPMNLDTVLRNPLETGPWTLAPIPTSPPTTVANMDVVFRKPPTPPPPPRSCIICTDATDQLIKPCRTCTSDYCKECLTDMFKAATSDSSRMPPRCCTLLQIHTVDLPQQDADDYRSKFEEWITLNKTYCPSPSCSAFIPDRLLPPSEPTPTITLQSILTDVLSAVSDNPSARFFRGELHITELPGYTTVVARPMDLGMIQASVQALSYSSMDDLTKDMMLIVNNAKLYNGSQHPIAKTADQLFQKHLSELSQVTDKLVLLATGTKPLDHFTCPKCHIAICVTCKQIEHSGHPCDTTAQDHELAMLEQFRYKRCPLCRHAVKKMYGCSHMQCVCGAHWCYYCQQSIDECGGACEERAGSEEEEEEEDEEEEDEEDEDDDGLDEGSLEGADEEGEDGDVMPQPASVVVDQEEPSVNETAAQTTPEASPITAPPPPSQLSDDSIINLDAGGARRWAESGQDFGDEPEEDAGHQIWSCPHSFDPFTAPRDEHNHGDLSRMECNRCFARVRVTYPVRGILASTKMSIQKVLLAKRSKGPAGAGAAVSQPVHREEGKTGG